MSRSLAVPAVILVALIVGLALRILPVLLTAQSTSPTPVNATADADPTGRAVSSRVGQRPLPFIAAGIATETALVGIILYMVLTTPWIARSIDGLRTRHQAIGAALIVLLVIGFNAGRDKTFPFVAWRMYAGSPADGLIVYQIIDADRGSAVPLNDIVPLLRHHRLTTAIGAMIKEADESGDEMRWQRVRHQLQALVQLYNRGALQPIRTVAIDKVTLFALQTERRVTIARLEEIQGS